MRHTEVAGQPQRVGAQQERVGGGGGSKRGRREGGRGRGGRGREKGDAVRKAQRRCWRRDERVAAGGSGTKRAAAWGALPCVWTIATARVLSRLKTVGAHPYGRGRARRGGGTVAAAAALPAGFRRPGLAADRQRPCPPRPAHARLGQHVGRATLLLTVPPAVSPAWWNSTLEARARHPLQEPAPHLTSRPPPPPPTTRRVHPARDAPLGAGAAVTVIPPPPSPPWLPAAAAGGDGAGATVRGGATRVFANGGRRRHCRRIAAAPACRRQPPLAAVAAVCRPARAPQPVPNPPPSTPVPPPVGPWHRGLPFPPRPVVGGGSVGMAGALSAQPPL